MNWCIRMPSNETDITQLQSWITQLRIRIENLEARPAGKPDVDKTYVDSQITKLKNSLTVQIDAIRRRA